jgi:hypothetical protein
MILSRSHRNISVGFKTSYLYSVQRGFNYYHIRIIKVKRSLNLYALKSKKKNDFFRKAPIYFWVG